MSQLAKGKCKNKWNIRNNHFLGIYFGEYSFLILLTESFNRLHSQRNANNKTQTDVHLLPFLVNEQQDAAEYFEKILRLTSTTASEVKMHIDERW